MNPQKIDMLVNKMTSLVEEEFTKKVLMPLFMAMGYKTDYHGGGYEGGKDLIFWKKDDFGEKELTVVQVKKTSVSAAASDKNGFPEIVTQLGQALEKQVPELDGTKRIPDKVIFITPYKINTRALESRFEGYANLRNRGARIYDGSQIAEQLINRKLPIVSELLGKEYELRESHSAGFSNRDLLSALGYGKERSVRHFYTDLDFGIGKVRTGTFLDINFTPVTIRVEIDEIDWNLLKIIVTRIEEYFDATITSSTVTNIENDFNRRFAEWHNKKNQLVIKKIDDTVEDIKELLDGLNFTMDQISPEISSRQKSVFNGGFGLREYISDEQNSEQDLDLVMAKASRSLRAIYKCCLSISDHISGGNERKLGKSTTVDLIESASSIKKEWPQIKEFIGAVKIPSLASIEGSTDSNIRKLDSTINVLVKSLSRRIPKPKYQVEINGGVLASKLRLEQQNLRERVINLQKTGKNDKNETRKFFDNCLRTLRVIDAIFSDSRLLQSIGVGGVDNQIDGNVRSSRIHIEIDKLFDTGMNVVLFGEAGAGKTTTLDMYAMKVAESEHQDWLPLYLPLTKIIGRTDNKNFDEIDAVSLLEDEIIRYFNANNLITNKEEFRNMLSKKGRVIFLLDGVDEISKSSPWMVDAIPKLMQSYPNSQFIISSRLTESQLDRVDFLKLTLMPFDDEQLKKFVSAWFVDNGKKVSLINEHLASNANISTIVKTPLLATILCVLAENNVPLPTSELSLYKERLKLLLGHYDVHKGIKRQESHHDVLEAVARKIAFGLHSRIKRMAFFDEIKEISIEALSTKFEKSAIETAVNELCDPCNILVPMSVQGEWGFGHLRYQEHLVAEELIRNRGIEIEPLLTSDWWRSVLILFSQLTDDFENIFTNRILSAGHIGAAHSSLRAMIDVRPKKERKELLQLLNRHTKMDDLDSEEFDEEESLD